MNWLILILATAVAGFAGFKLGRRKPPRPAAPVMLLEEQVSQLFGLLLRTYGLYLFVKPMLFDQALIARYSETGRGRWFVELRNVLYWHMVLEICKLAGDGDSRSPCIRKLRAEIARPEIRQWLEHERMPVRPDFPGSARTMYEMLRGAELKAQKGYFAQHHQKLMEACDRLLKNPALIQYRLVRNKLIAHNEHQLVDGKLQTLDVGKLGLKYGDERLLLENMKEIMDEMSAVVRGVAFDWDSFFGPEQRDVDEFWGLGRPA